MLSPCSCSGAAVAYLELDGKTFVIACEHNHDWQCFARVEGATIEEATAKWENVEYDLPAGPRVPLSQVAFPPHWTERWTQPNQHNMIAACCRSLKYMEIEHSRSNSRQFKPDRYTFICTDCGKRQMSLCVGTEGVGPDGKVHWRPWWEPAKPANSMVPYPLAAE